MPEVIPFYLHRKFSITLICKTLNSDIRLKKEHELVRQETVQVILGEQKLQVEHRLLKNELDELSKVRGQGHIDLVSVGMFKPLQF